jgi:hypothetical protein
MNNKIKAGIYTILILLLLGLTIYSIAKYPLIVLTILITIALGVLVYCVYGLVYIYLEGKEEDPFLF